jgi:RNA polymerase sigma-70 factor (ECF subfamily)
MSNERAPLRDTDDNQADFLALIRAAKDGCDQAMDQLIRECQPYLLAIANVEIDRDVAPKVGASDIVQNSILSAQRCIGEFEGDNREELLAWLRGILIRDLKQTHRHYRAAKRHVGREQPLRDDSFAAEEARFFDAGDSPSTAAADREQEERLYRAMRRLPDIERQVLELRNWQRMPFAEIGQQMDRSSEAARKLWSRAIVRLQKLMDEADA